MSYKLDDALLYSVDSRVFISDGNLFRTTQTPLELGEVEILGMVPNIVLVGLETLTQEINIMAFNLKDIAVRIQDQTDQGATQGISVQSAEATSINSADITVDIDPSAKLGSIKAEIDVGGAQGTSTLFQTFVKDYIGVMIPNSLSFDALDADPSLREGAADGAGVLPIQPGTSHSLTYHGYGFFHATTGIYGSQGLAAHQGGVGVAAGGNARAAGWESGTYSASPADIPAGDPVPFLADVLGGDVNDQLMNVVNTEIAVNGITIAGREASHRTEFVLAMDLVGDPAAAADMLLPEGKQDAKLRVQAWDGSADYSVAEMSEVAFQVALRPIASGSADMDGTAIPATADPATYAGPALTAGSSSGTLTLNVADSLGNACLGTSLSHSLEIVHDVFSTQTFTLSGSPQIDTATGKEISQNFSVPASSPIGIYNVLVRGDQNGSTPVNVGQVIVEAAAIVVAGEQLIITSVTPGEFDAAENALIEWGEKTTLSLTLAAGANLPGPDEGTFLYAYLTKGATRYEFVDNECVVTADNAATLVLDLQPAAAADQLDGATFNYGDHTGDFTLHLEVYDRNDADSNYQLEDSDDMFARPADGASILSQGSFDGVLITSEAPLKVLKDQMQMDNGQEAEFDGVARPEVDRWIQAGTDNALGAALTLKYAVVNASSSTNAPGADDAADLHQTHVLIVRESDGQVVGDSRLGASKLAGNHGDGSDEMLFLISNLQLADRVGGAYGTGEYRNGFDNDGNVSPGEAGLVTDLQFDLQAIHEEDQDANEPGVGVEVSMDANYSTSELPAYRVEVVTRAVDMGANPAEESLQFSGEAAFYVFPAQIEEATLGDAILQVAPSGTTLQQVLSIIDARGIFPTTYSGGGATLTDILFGIGGGANVMSGSGGSWDIDSDVSGLINAFRIGATAHSFTLDEKDGGQLMDFATPVDGFVAGVDEFFNQVSVDGVTALFVLPLVEGMTDQQIVDQVAAEGIYLGMSADQVIRSSDSDSDFSRNGALTTATDPNGIAILYILDGQD